MAADPNQWADTGPMYGRANFGSKNKGERLLAPGIIVFNTNFLICIWLQAEPEDKGGYCKP